MHRLLSQFSASSNQARTRRADRGAVLPLTLIFMVFGSLVVVALLTFATTLFRNRPPLEERSDSYEAVQAAMHMAVTMQRSFGPEDCYPHTDGDFEINNRSVDVTCTVLEDENELGGRYGVLTTSNTGDVAEDNAAFDVLGGANVRNGVFVQGGSLAAGTSGIRLLDGSTLEASTGSSVPDGLSQFRYTMLDRTFDIDVSATPTCGEIYGPDAVEQIIDGSSPTSTAEVNVVGVPGGLELTPSAGTRVLGIVVVSTNGSIFLEREPATGSTYLLATTDGGAIDELRACIQTGVADTDPTYVPTDLTFCGSPLLDPEQYQHVDGGDGVNCLTENWWEVAGWKPNALAPYVRPMLPEIPTYLRSATPRQVGSSNCYVFYPGRYQGELILDGGRQYYFPSGVYLFDSPIRVSDGARVVGGEGQWAGCTFDAEASFLPGSPSSHEITGKGVTFLFSDAAMLDVDNASVRLNDRVGTSSTRASSGINIMTVNAQMSSPEFTLPSDDQVLMPGCLASQVAATPSCAVDIGSYSSTPVAGGPTLGYSASALAHDDLVIDAVLDGSTASTNQIRFGGAVYTPNAAVAVERSAGGSAYRADFVGGLTATTIDVDVPVGSTFPPSFGEGAAAVYLRVLLEATTTFDDRVYTSSVELEVDDIDRYAINSWVNDEVITATGGGSSDGGSADGGSADGGSADGGSADGGSADGGSADGGSADGGSADGGSADGGSADGGSADGGSADGGSADGGSADGGSADGGSTDGGSTGPGDTGPGSAVEPYTCLAEVPASADGRYWFDFGAGAFEASVDSDEGGAWVLVLQYQHAGGTNPAPSALGSGSDWPLESADPLGTDGNLGDGWGHLGQAAASAIPDDPNALELRWYAATDAHNRTIHFRSPVLGQFQTDSKPSFLNSGIASNFTPLTSHSAAIPASVNGGFSSQGDLTLTNFPFYRGGAAHWGVDGRGYRWEVDDFPNSGANSTVHRVWVRSNADAATCSAPPAGPELGDQDNPFVCLAQVPSDIDGRYWFDFGAGAFEASVDSDEGGSWVLILQYAHAGSSNPSVVPLSTGADWPLESTDTLGANGSSTAGWGHVGQAVAASIPDASGDLELRWWGQTSDHNRLVHFRSPALGKFQSDSEPNFVSSGIRTNFTPLGGHSSNLPGAATSGYNSGGDLALTRFPFYSGNYWWSINANGTWWESDNYATGGGYGDDTLHRVWVRSGGDPATCAGSGGAGGGGSTPVNDGPTHPTIVGSSGEPIGNHPEFDYCASGQSTWTSNFGTGSWLQETWNFNSSTNTGNYGENIFVGNPDEFDYVTAIDEDWGSSAGPSGVNNYFGIRYTATINVPDNCTMDLQVAGDDGYALYVNGTRTVESWQDQGTTFTTGSTTLQPGENLVVLEWYEWGGEADISLEWRLN